MDLALLVRRIEHVARDPDRQRRHRDARHRALDRTTRTGDVVQIHRLADHEVAVGVEAMHQSFAVVLEVALDLELLPQPERVAERRPVGEIAPEAIGEHVVAAERDLGDLAGDGETLGRAVAGLGVVVVAAPPAWVETNRTATDRTPRDLLGGGLHARRDRGDRADPPRIRDRPLEHLHPTHRSADDRVPRLDPEVRHQADLGADHVADRHDREARAVRAAVGGVWRRRPGRALAPAEHVGAHDEPPIGVERQPGADDVGPPARCVVTVPGAAGGVAVARPRVTDEDGVRAIVVEHAPRLVGDHRRRGGRRRSRARTDGRWRT